MVAVKAGDRIAIHYRAARPDGQLVLSSEGGPALEMVAAGGDVITGVSMGVVGMELGERRVLRLAPEQAFGADEGAVERLIPASRLPAGAAIGDQLCISMAGLSARVWIVAADAAGFRVRTEHGLAGQNLVVEIELVSLLNSQRGS